MINSLTQAEELYTYKSSTQIMATTGLIGHFDCSISFENIIFDSYRNDLVTDVFKSDLAEVTAYLNEEKTDNNLRIDKGEHSFLLRCEKGQAHCYCYVSKWLDSHIREAEKGIRFIDSRYNDKFRLRDGGEITIKFSDGTSRTKECRFIDSYHVQVGNIYHICEFAERMERNGNIVTPNPSDLVSEGKIKNERGVAR